MTVTDQTQITEQNVETNGNDNPPTDDQMSYLNVLLSERFDTVPEGIVPDNATGVSTLIDELLKEVPVAPTSNDQKLNLHRRCRMPIDDVALRVNHRGEYVQSHRDGD